MCAHLCERQRECVCVCVCACLGLIDGEMVNLSMYIFQVCLRGCARICVRDKENMCVCVCVHVWA
ncbi:MAG TPA: hypothetical protein V6C97_00110 [Oculatellaceae cyanobacterium]